LQSLRIALVILLAVTASSAQTPKRGTQHRPAPSPAQNQQLQDDMQAINALHNKNIEASLALDEAVLESLWTDDVVTMHPGSPPIVGRAANAERLKAGIEKMKDQEVLAYNEEFQEIRIQGDWAYEWGSITGRTRPFSGGNETSYKFNVMRILQRQPDGNWKVARSIYNDAAPLAAPKPEEKPKQDERNKLKD
jgi:ketosteroid isomerase-like protein